MKAIVTLANDKGHYLTGLERMRESLLDKFDGDFFGFKSESEVGAPLHHVNPYAFKLFAIANVLAEGYDQILWLDSSVYAIKNVQPIFDIIEQKGYFMQQSGALLDRWCNDYCRQTFELSHDESKNMSMYSAGFTGLNFNNDKAANFFFSWSYAMMQGCFKGDWSNHRHDMTCASIIANRLGFTFERGDMYVQYCEGDNVDKINNDSIVLKVQGL